MQSLNCTIIIEMCNPEKPLIFLLLISFLQLQAANGQHFSISGKVYDSASRLPLDSAVVNIFNSARMFQATRYTDTSGYFMVDSLPPSKYEVYVMRRSFRVYQNDVAVADSSHYLTPYLYKENQDWHPRDSFIEDIAAEDIVHAGIAVSFYNPPLNAGPGLFKSSFNTEWISCYKTKLTRYSQLGFEFSPFKLAWHYLDKDTINTSQIFKNEKYFAYYVNAFVFGRLFITKQKKNGYPGLFIDLGGGYDLPIFFRYSYFPEKSHKAVVKNIHNFQEVSAMFRLGFDLVTVKATYRFFDILKNDFTQPPKLKIGLEIQVGDRYN
jgi:hypothetical protein